MTLQTIHSDSTHPDTYNLVGFSKCLHLWWISCSPRAKCYKCYNVSIPHTRLALNEFQASSHHKSQSALSETN